MSRLALILAALLAALLAVPALAGAADTPRKESVSAYGPDARFLLDGDWLFRLDPEGVGLDQRWQRETTTANWTEVEVPNAWNATDISDASMAGTVGWYRKDFKLPNRSSRFDWVVRFESVNYRARVWLNGKPVDTNTGAYLPFEIRLPRSYLKRSGTNRLVIRVDNRRLPTDFPPSGLSKTGQPTGGWWNYGGLLREVYLRRIDRVEMTSVRVRPILPCRTCDARVEMRVVVRNASDRTQRVRMTGDFGNRDLDLGAKRVGPKEFASFTETIRVRDPELWSPEDPNLTSVRFRARLGDRVADRWYLRTGIRSIRVSKDGLLYLNGRRVNFRGVGLHEDSLDKGFAIGPERHREIIAQAKELGATLIRSHYPLHPYMHELADREGLMVWSEIPVYAVKTKYLARLEVRELARKELELNIRENQNHPSIVVWSVGNELSARPGPVQGNYLERAVEQAKAMDPTRPVGYAVAGYPSAGCQPEYEPLDIIGINEYFGWYVGPNGQIADRELMSGFLDDVRECYPDKAVVITETGAEANRHGPVEEKGTYEHQVAFANYHFGVYATKEWLSGAIWWALQEFRVRPGWDGGNPRPNPPIHQKGLLAFGGEKKPAWFEVQRIFKETTDVGAAR